MRLRRWALLPLLLALTVTSRAQEAGSQTFTLEDREVDDALDQARALEQQGSYAERGDLPRAERVFLRLERETDATQDEARRYAFFRLIAAAGRGDPTGAADALASFEAKGGDAEAGRIPIDGRLASPKEAVDYARK